VFVCLSVNTIASERLEIYDDAKADDVAVSAAEAYENGNNASRQYCTLLFDNVICWPNTEAGQLAVVPCPTHFKGLQLSGGQYRIFSSLCHFPNFEVYRASIWIYDLVLITTTTLNACVEHLL